MLSSLLLPTDGPDSDGEEYSGLDFTDTRLAAMGIISFIPCFNWLSWVFAWLDTGKRRYGVCALVYLAPYLGFFFFYQSSLIKHFFFPWFRWWNMSLPPDESWLPLASIIFGIAHVQLEASIRNGDIQGFQFFTKASNDATLKGDRSQLGRMEDRDVPSNEEQSRKGVWKQGTPRKPSEHRKTPNGDWHDESRDERKH